MGERDDSSSPSAATTSSTTSSPEPDNQSSTPERSAATSADPADTATERDEGSVPSEEAERKPTTDVAVGVFREGSSVCICEMFPPQYMNVVTVNLDVLAELIPINSDECSSIIGVKYGQVERGIVHTKKPAKKRRKGMETDPPTLKGNRFQHQVRTLSRSWALMWAWGEDVDGSGGRAWCRPEPKVTRCRLSGAPLGRSFERCRISAPLASRRPPGAGGLLGANKLAPGRTHSAPELRNRGSSSPG